MQESRLDTDAVNIHIITINTPYHTYIPIPTTVIGTYSFHF